MLKLLHTNPAKRARTSFYEAGNLWKITLPETHIFAPEKGRNAPKGK